MVNGSRARPLDAPEPRRLGQAPTPAGPRNITQDPQPRALRSRHHEHLDPHNASSNGKPHAAPALDARHTEQRTRPPCSDRSSAAPERVLAAFQETMQKFLDVQRTTMLAYLSGRQPLPAEPPVRPCRATPLPERAAPPEPHAPAAATSLPLLLRNAGRDRPRRRDDRAGRSSAPAGREAIARKLLDIVRERTGYPLEVLRLELDLEAELGIDSIKRVEILGKLRDAFPQLGNAADPEAMDRLASAKTLAAIVDRVERAIGQGKQRGDSEFAFTAASTLAS